MKQYRTHSRDHNSSFEAIAKREAITSELDEHSNRIKELLRADLTLLQEENALLRTKSKQIPELQEKIDMILKHNAQLLAENEKLAKMFHQKKSELEIIQNKYDTKVKEKYGTSSTLEFEKKKLQNEVQHLNNELSELERIKNAQIGDVRAQSQMEIQNLKRQQASTQQLFDMELRKLKETLEKRDYELVDANNRIKRLSNDSEYELLKITQEKQRLRNELDFAENNNKKQLESLKFKLQAAYLEELEAIKKKQIRHTEELELQNMRSKEVLDTKKVENQQLFTKISKLKQHYEETLALLRKENETLRQKLIQCQSSADMEIDTLKSKLAKLHQNEIQEISRTHQRHIECLQDQITKLESITVKKNEEIEQLIKEKTITKQMYDAQLGRLKEEIGNGQVRLKDLENNLRRNNEIYEQKIKDKDGYIEYLDKLNNDQQLSFEQEQTTIKEAFENTKKQLQSQKSLNKEKQQRQKEQISQIKQQLENNKEVFRKYKQNSERQSNNISEEYEAQIEKLRSKLESKESSTKILEKQIQSVKNHLTSREKEIKNLGERQKRSEEQIKKLEKENDSIRSKIIEKDQRATEMMAEQKKRLQESHNFAMENFKNDYEAALELEKAKQAEIIDQKRKKQRQLDDLLKAYKKMRQGFEKLSEQEAEKKDMTLKLPGATADLIATKNMFDVFLKARVLDICPEKEGQEKS